MTPPPSDDASRAAQEDLSRRVREIREFLYGEDSGQRVADAMSLPLGTWTNYESGVAIPSLVILRFIELTGANPLWLLRGEGDKFTSQSPYEPPGDGDGFAE